MYLFPISLHKNNFEQRCWLNGQRQRPQIHKSCLFLGLCFTITHAESFVLLQMDSNASSSYMHSQAREQASYLLYCYFFISPGPI